MHLHPRNGPNDEDPMLPEKPPPKPPPPPPDGIALRLVQAAAMPDTGATFQFLE